MLYRILGGFVLVFAANVLAIGDIAQGKTRAVTCVGCHGVQGIAAVPTFPNLAGQKQAYLITAIKSYQNGRRNNPIMKAMAAALSAADIESIAAYYASLPRK